MPVLRSGNVTTPENLKMTRSRNVTTPENVKMTPEALENACYEPSTPMKTPEVLNKKTDSSTPSTILQGAGKGLGSGSEAKSVPKTSTVGRRSLRLAEKTGVGLNSVGGNVEDSIHKRKDVSPDDLSQLGNSKIISDSESDDLCTSVKRVKVSEEVGMEICHSGDTVQFPAKGVKINLEQLQDSGTSGQCGERSESEKRGKGKRRTGNDNDRKLLNLRSGKRLSKRIFDEERSDLNVSESSIKDKEVVVDTDLPSNDLEHEVGKVTENGVETRGISKRLDEVGEKLVDNNIASNGFDTLEQRLENGDGANAQGVKTRNRPSRLDKGKEKMVDIDISNGDGDGTNAEGVKTRNRPSRLDKGKEKMADIDIDIAKAIEAVVENRSRESRLDKGKGKITELDDSIGGSDSASPTENVTLQVDDNVPAEKRSIRDRFRDMAKKNASKFAHFVAEEEENTVADDALGDNSHSVDGKTEDWPGFFSTAMKIIKDREEAQSKGQLQPQNSSTGKTKTLTKWIPRRGPDFDCRKRSVPSLQDMCWPVLVNNANAITSLDFIPDVLKHKLSQLLCDCRRMNCHVLELLVSGSPTEIRVRECSWLSEENFTKIFERCDTSNLTVLQLDLCGCCLADYILYTTLASSPNSLPALTNISLKGAYRLSDAGLSTLATSAPSLRSINLSQCSLLTSDGINCLADSLGPVLRELYIDECQGIDAMLILPALLKMQHLEVLSVASIETVNNNFVSKFVTAQGHNLKELILKDCMKLTDSSVKAIAENCSRLCSIDLSNLRKLTDFALGYLAYGCRSIHTLKIGRNLFSDEAVAAYIETCGDYLKELSLNYVTQVADNTAVSLAKCSKLLQTLDLSFCRNISNEGLGLIVDSCSSLGLLKLFGCSQVKDVFLRGHSNPHVQIIGLKMTSVVRNLKDPVLPQGSTFY